MRVLVVDDNADIRLLLEQVLSSAGIDVDEAENGAAALKMLHSEKRLPDLVLLDIQMPFVDGWKVLEGIRGDEHTAGVPVVLCTVKSSPDNVERGFSMGCDGYVTKPFDVGEVVEEVRTVAARSAAERSSVRKRVLERASQSLQMIVTPRPLAV